MQRPAVPDLTSFSPLPAGHLHDPGGHPVALDAAMFRAEFRALLDDIRGDLVADSVHPRRLRS